jgi:hypothetical protein
VVRGVCFGASALLLACLAGCADEPVTLTSPRVSAQDLATCDSFLDDLPNQLAGHDLRKVNPAAALGRAWGNPPIIVRCGVGLPAAYDAFATCEQADGVGWFVPDDELQDQGKDVVFTAVGYRPIVSVTVPHDDRPEGAAAAIAQLAQPVSDHLELVKKCR